MIRNLFIFFNLLSISVCYGKGGNEEPVGTNIFCALSFPEAARPNLNTIYIPFSLVGHLIVVQANADTLSGNFILDTGSERLVLNQQYFKPDFGNRTVVATGNTGMVSSVTEMKVDTLLLDRLFILNLRAHVVDLSHIEEKKNARIIGILGYDVFEDFELFIDFQNSRIVLSRLDRNGVRLDSIRNWEIPHDSLKFELKRHVIVVDGYVNTIRLHLMLDSGAELNLIDRKTNRKALDRFTIIKRVNLIGIGKRQVEVIAGTLNDMKVGNEHCASMNTLLTSLDDINESFGVSLNGVLGYEFLSKRRVMINYKKRKLYFFDPLRS
ncbi:MAG: hypothetical protein ABJB16_18780 [Saprospiraceae bacterium]